MTLTVDLNADMGESFGPWVMGADAELLQVVTSANVPCRFHAGDPQVMAKTMKLAVENNVGIGAHPGFDDLQNFGRRRLNVPHDELAHQLQYQFGAAQAMARAAGGQVRHMKLHGALSNMACEDYDLAKTCYEAILSVDPDVILMVLAATKLETAAGDLGANLACEIFADRAYNDDATLVDRSIDGAVIHDADVAAKRMVEMVTRGGIITASGKLIKTQIDTICLHGDTAGAVDIARTVRSELERAGVTVRRF